MALCLMRLDHNLLWNKTIINNELQFYFHRNDNDLCVWKLRRDYINPAFTLQWHMDTTTGVIVWDAII